MYPGARYHITGVLLLVMLLTGRNLVAYDGPITTTDGISNNKINAICQDSDGYIWIGTNDGLNRFDGYEFLVFRHNIHDSASLSSNRIFCIDEDPDGYLWVGTEMGVSRYDPTTGNFRNHVFYPYYTGRKANRVIDIAIDENGDVWVLLPAAVIRIHAGTGSFDEFRLEGDPGGVALSSWSTLMYHGTSGLVFLGTEDGLLSLDPDTGELRPRAMKEGYIRALYCDRKGRIWVGTSKGLELFHWDAAGQGSLVHETGALRNMRVIDIMEDEEGDLLVLAGGELYRYREGLISRDVPGVGLLNGWEGTTSPRLFCVDRSEVCWIGTWRGLFRKDLKVSPFSYYSRASEGWRSHNDRVTSILENGRELMIGSWEGGLEILDLEDGSVEWFHRGSPSNYFPETSVNVIHKDTTGRIWVAARDLYLFNRENGTFKNSQQLFQEYSGNRIERSRIFDILDIGKDLLVVAHSSGIYYIDHERQTIRNDTVIRYDTLALQIYDATSLARDTDRLWIGFASGILMYALSDSTYRFYPSGDVCGLSGEVLTLRIDRKGRLWAGTQSGLFLYLPQYDRFSGYSVQHGFANDYIYSIEEDSSGNLWIGTNRGISSFNPESSAVNNYGVSAGLSNLEFNQQASFYAPSGRMYFGSIEGVNFFYPDSVTLSYENHPVRITGYQVFNRETSTMAKGGGTRIEISDRDAVRLNFALLDYTSPGSSEYRYRLLHNGVGNGWVRIGTDHSVILSGLEHGVHRFEVDARSAIGQWSLDPATVELVVSAPFYRRKAFVALLFLPVLLLVYYFFEYRTRTLRQNNRALREKEIVAREVLRQKNLLSRRNKNIEDSLKYAQRIQHAMFTSSMEIKELFPGSFILQKPKDIVSGDFFWAGRIGSRIFLTAVDCTGHGVPGAFMSLIGLEFLRQIVTINGVFKPSQVLDQLNDSFEELFGGMQDISLKDGMDMSFCSFDIERNTLEYAGAFNPLYIIRNGELIEIKADKCSVGPNLGFQRRPFTNHEIALQENDTIYLFSDGYPDQFGGPEGKKFKYRRFRHLLLSISERPMEMQQKLLENSIEDWKGDLEQVDDILVIGVRPIAVNGYQTSRKEKVMERVESEAS